MIRLAKIAVVIAVPLSGCGDGLLETREADTAATPSTTSTETASSDSAEVTTGPAADSADAEAQAAARTTRTAMEVYATENGSYDGASLDALQALAPETPEDAIVSAAGEGYRITIPSAATGNYFTIERFEDGSTTFTCTEPGVADCGADGTWD